MSISEKLKTKHGVLKYILKEAVRGLIPDEIINRPKQGFGVPISEWIFGQLGELARKELTDFCKRTEYIDYDKTMRLIDEKRGRHIWYLLNFALWWKEFVA
jgi:asparagine synthase (glutamine-hydrolysing)